MQFAKVDLDAVLAELGELPSNWMDEQARELVAHIHASVPALRRLRRPVEEADLEASLRADPRFLDVCRLFLGQGQEPVAHLLFEQLGGKRVGWARLRTLARLEPERMAAALAGLGLLEVINDQLHRRWRLEDVLVERYRLGRGRAIAGQQRGRGLEDEVEAVLAELQVPFERGVTFRGRKKETAKCDFAVPTKQDPKVIIEAKGFEATGSKLTDFLGDILKIAQAKDFHMYFFLVTDGRGWHHRVSDLRRIIKLHDEGLIDMVYTRVRLGELGEAVQHIYLNE